MQTTKPAHTITLRYQEVRSGMYTHEFKFLNTPAPASCQWDNPYDDILLIIQEDVCYIYDHKGTYHTFHQVLGLHGNAMTVKELLLCLDANTLLVKNKPSLTRYPCAT